MQAPLLVKQDLWGIVSWDTSRPTGSLTHKAIVAWQKKHDTAAAKISTQCIDKVYWSLQQPRCTQNVEQIENDVPV